MPLVQTPAPSRRYPRARLTGSGLSLPDFATALIAAANWGLTDAFKQGINSLMYMSGTVAVADIYADTTAPHYCDLESVEALGLPIVTLDRWYDQAINAGDRFEAADPVITYALTGRSHKIRVADGGTAGTNGDYIPFGEVNGRMSWTPDGAGDPLTEGIFWDGIELRWEITLATATIYFSGDDVASPDLATTWAKSSGTNPPPVVTRFSDLTAGEVTIN